MFIVEQEPQEYTSRLLKYRVSYPGYHTQGIIPRVSYCLRIGIEYTCSIGHDIYRIDSIEDRTGSIV